MAETKTTPPVIPVDTLKTWLSKVNKKEVLDMASFKQVCEAARAKFTTESSLLQLTAPLVAVGDIHGNFDDLKEVLRIGGSPAKTKYLFMGDIVDRGDYSVPCIQLVLLLKLLFPTNVYLLRGNHECRKISEVYGFKAELYTHYRCPDGDDIHETCCNVFDALPLAAIVNNKTFVVHGGLSPSISTLKQITDLPRNCDVPFHGPMTDLLWSDPDADTAIFGVSPRGAGFVWGPMVTKTFCDTNGIDMIIRSHQLVNKGFEYSHDNRVLTVFTASNYCNKCDNQGGFVKLGAQLEREIVQLDVGGAAKHTDEASALVESIAELSI